MRYDCLGDAMLFNADCRDVMCLLPRVQAVVTDPPYGIKYKTKYRQVMDTPAMLVGDDSAPLWSVGLMAAQVCDGGALYICTSFKVFDSWLGEIRRVGLTPKTPIVWDKTAHTAGDLQGDYGCRTELILFAHKGRHILRGGRPQNLWAVPREPAGPHPTPEPVELMRRCIVNSTDPGDIILDPFMGSGTTGVAALQTGRKFIGIEIDQGYYSLAYNRIAAISKPATAGGGI